jgi:hypothetical protein
VRIADLLAHGWDRAQATGQPAQLPEDLAEQALAFVRIQLSTQSRIRSRQAASLFWYSASLSCVLVCHLARWRGDQVWFEGDLVRGVGCP